MSDFDSSYSEENYFAPSGFLNSLNLPLDSESRLNNYLNGLIKGSNIDVVSGICTNVKPEKLLSMWDDVFSSNKELINENLMNIEMESKAKFGPRSISKPWSERVSGVKDHFSFDSDTADFNSLTFPLPFKGFRPLSLTNSVSYLRNDTNSGLPYFMPKSRIKPKLIKMINDGKFPSLLKREDPCILFTRTQEGNKTRDVWGYPVADTLLEMSYYQPVLNYQRGLPWRSAIVGPNNVDTSVSAMINKCSNSDGLVLVSIDFSSFDRSVHPELSTVCFRYIKSLFNSKYHDELDYICHRFISIGLVTPDGVFTGLHGVPSGSTFTNEVDSLAQYIIALNAGIEILDFQVQGDDGVYLIHSSDESIFISNFEKYGLTVNTGKSINSNNFCVYLRCLFDKHYTHSDGVIRGVYPTYRALGRICYQERFVDFLSYGLTGQDYYSLRTISILENCKYHPLFNQLVKFVRDNDKYLLKYSKEALGKYKRLQSEVFGFDNTVNPRPGDDISGISSFSTVKVLNSLP